MPTTYGTFGAAKVATTSLRPPLALRRPDLVPYDVQGGQANSRKLMVRGIVSRALLVGAVLLTPPARGPSLAQSNPFADLFGSIFGNPPPPPPGRPGPPSSRQQPPPYYPSGRDTPPSQPLPAPMNLPPSNRPGQGNIQTQPLAPPPGGVVAPQPPSGQAPQGTAVAPGQTPTALPPGPGSPRNVPQPANTAPQPNDAVIVEPPAQRIINPAAV